LGFLFLILKKTVLDGFMNKFINILNFSEFLAKNNWTFSEFLILSIGGYKFSIENKNTGLDYTLKKN